MLTLAVAPPAQAEIFVTVRGQRQGVIRGDSTVKGHETQIVASSFDYDVKAPRDPATGLATGKRQHSPITLRLNSGAASVHLFQALVTNENLTSVVIDFVAASDVGGLVSLKRVTLTNAAGSSERHWTRMDTSWVNSDPQSVRTIRVGDFITTALTGTRAVRLGGIQLRSNFDLRPDMVTFPLPALRGTAVVPSAVDLYINNVRQFSGQASGGPFAIDTPPA